MRFEKWQALGNDYIVVEREEIPFELTPERVAAICAPHFGIHSDGILLLSPAADPAHVAELRIFNPDGSEAELSGNGAREAVLYLRRSGWTEAGHVHDPDRGRRDHADADRAGHGPGCDGQGLDRLARTTPAAPRTAAARSPSAASSASSSTSRSATRSARSRSRRGSRTSTCRAIGPAIESAPIFPNRTNVSFWQARGIARPGADLRARGGGDPLLRHRRLRRRRRRSPAGRAEPAHGRARRRRARGGDRRRPRDPADRDGRAGLRRASSPTSWSSGWRTFG